MNHYKRTDALYQKLELLTQEDIDKVFSYRELCRMLSLKEYKKSGTYQGYDIVKKFVDNHFNISHFTGQGWNKGNFDYTRFKKGKLTKDIKLALINLRSHRCQQCGMSKWFEESIPLEVHHVDGDNLNNELSNLILLCPNCHAQTDNWRGKNINQGKKKVSDDELIKALKENDNIRQALISVGLAPKGGNYNRAYELKAKIATDLTDEKEM